MQRLRNLHLSQMSQKPVEPGQSSMKMMKLKLKNDRHAANVLRQVTKMKTSALGTGSKDAVKPKQVMTTEEFIKRHGLDPVRFDRRSWREILDDEIPEQRWADEAKSKTPTK